jgi:hypothetical protein
MRHLKSTSFNVNVQEQVHNFFIRKDISFFTFTVTSHANSLKLLYMLRHSTKYHAYLTFCADKLEFMLKIRTKRKLISSHMKDLNAENYQGSEY